MNSRTLMIIEEARVGLVREPAAAVIGSGDTVSMSDNTEYTGSDISTLTLTMSGSPKCRLSFTTAAEGSISITFPAGTRFQNATAPVFSAGEYWELDFNGLNCNYCIYGTVD